MTDFTPEVMMHGGIEANFDQIKPTCIAVAKSLGRRKRDSCDLSGRYGPHVQDRRKTRERFVLRCRKGQFSTIPTIEANTTPIEGTAEGVIVCDASIPYLGIGLVDEPVICKVEKGFITDIKGGRAAEILKKDLASHGDKTATTLQSLGSASIPNAGCAESCSKTKGSSARAPYRHRYKPDIGGRNKSSVPLRPHHVASDHCG